MYSSTYSIPPLAAFDFFYSCAIRVIKVLEMEDVRLLNELSSEKITEVT